MTQAVLHMEALKLIELFGERIGIRGLEPDDEGTLVLRIDGNEYMLTLDGQTRRLNIARLLRSVPVSEFEELRLLRVISQLNCFQSSTRGGAIGVYDGGLYYSAGIAYTGLTAAELERFVFNVIELTNRLLTQIEEGLAEQDQSSSELEGANNYYIPI